MSELGSPNRHLPSTVLLKAATELGHQEDHCVAAEKEPESIEERVERLEEWRDLLRTQRTLAWISACMTALELRVDALEASEEKG